MGYIRKHKKSLRSGFELFAVLFFTIGLAPVLAPAGDILMDKAKTQVVDYGLKTIGVNKGTKKK